MGNSMQRAKKSNDVSLHNSRMRSIVDLYEVEYNEDFKKSICTNPCHGSIENLGETEALSSSPKSMLVDCENEMNIEFIPPDEQSIVDERLIEMGSDSMDFTEENERSTYLNSGRGLTEDNFFYMTQSLDDDSYDARPQTSSKTRKVVVKRRRRSKEPHNSPEEADNKSSLDDTINYMKTLKFQVQMMTMSNRFVTPSKMLPLGPHYSQMDLATAMQMSVPHHVGTGLPGINHSTDMLRFLNHPGLMPTQNSTLHTSGENCSPQPIPPSSAAFPSQIPNTNSLSNLDDARRNGGILSGKKSEKP